MIYNEIILAVMFGCIGFILSFFLTKVINVGLLLLLSWVSFKAIESAGVMLDWTLFYKLNDHMVDTGRVIYELIMNMMSMASTGAMMVFVLGGIMGMVLNLRTRAAV